MRRGYQPVWIFGILLLVLAAVVCGPAVTHAQDDCLAACTLIHDPALRERCEIDCAVQEHIRDVAARLDRHYLIVNALEKIQCYRDTGDWERCWGVFRLSPFPPPDPLDKKLIQSLAQEDRDRLRANLIETIKQRHEYEMKLLEELFQK